MHICFVCWERVMCEWPCVGRSASLQADPDMYRVLKAAPLRCCHLQHAVDLLALCPQCAWHVEAEKGPCCKGLTIKNRPRETAEEGERSSCREDGETYCNFMSVYLGFVAVMWRAGAVTERVGFEDGFEGSKRA